MKLSRLEKIWLISVIIFYFLYNLPFFPPYHHSGDRYPHAPDHYPSVDRRLLRADQNLPQTETEKKRGG